MAQQETTERANICWKLEIIVASLDFLIPALL